VIGRQAAGSADLDRSRRYDRLMDVTYEWRGDFENAEANALHADGFGHRVLEDDWKAQVQRHSTDGEAVDLMLQLVTTIDNRETPPGSG
jgi:hypothetical protein